MECNPISDIRESGNVLSSGPEATHVASRSAVSGDEARESWVVQWAVIRAAAVTVGSRSEGGQ